MMILLFCINSLLLLCSVFFAGVIYIPLFSGDRVSLYSAFQNTQQHELFVILVVSSIIIISLTFLYFSLFMLLNNLHQKSGRLLFISNFYPKLEPFILLLVFLAAPMTVYMIPQIQIYIQPFDPQIVAALVEIGFCLWYIGVRFGSNKTRRNLVPITLLFIAIFVYASVYSVFMIPNIMKELQISP